MSSINEKNDKETSRGFTLVELLVALVIFALISTMLIGTLRFARMAWAKGDAATARIERTQMAMDLLRRELEEATSLSIANNKQPPPVTFVGDEKNVVFLAPPAAALAMGGLQLMWLSLDRGGTHMVLRWRNFDTLNEDWPPALDGGRGMAELALGEAPGGVDLAYFGPDATANSVSRWRGDWSDMAFLPTLIRLSFKGNGIPDLLISPHQGGAAGIFVAGGQARN